MPFRSGAGTRTRSPQKINGVTRYLWRAVDHEGELLEVFATKRRDRKAAPALLKRAMERYGRPQAVVTDRLRSDGVAMGTTARFRDIEARRKLTSAHAPTHNRVNLDRHLSRKATFKEDRSAAQAERRELAA